MPAIAITLTDSQFAAVQAFAKKRSTHKSPVTPESLLMNHINQIVAVHNNLLASQISTLSESAQQQIQSIIDANQPKSETPPTTAG